MFVRRIMLSCRDLVRNCRVTCKYRIYLFNESFFTWEVLSIKNNQMGRDLERRWNIYHFTIEFKTCNIIENREKQCNTGDCVTLCIFEIWKIFLYSVQFRFEIGITRVWWKQYGFESGTWQETITCFEVFEIFEFRGCRARDAFV